MQLNTTQGKLGKKGVHLFPAIDKLVGLTPVKVASSLDSNPRGFLSIQTNQGTV